MPTESEVLKQALDLPAAQRAAIARSLLESLDEDVDGDEQAVADAWAAEIEARAAAYDRGEVQSVDGRTAIERIRQSIRRGERA